MKVTSIRKMTFGHLVMELSDGSVTIFGRGEPQPDVKVGDEYPPTADSPNPALPSESDLDAVSVEKQAAADTEGQPAQVPDSTNMVGLLSDGLKQANERIAELENLIADERKAYLEAANIDNAVIAALQRETIELRAAVTVATTPLDEQLAEQPAPPQPEPETNPVEGQES